MFVGSNVKELIKKLKYPLLMEESRDIKDKDKKPEKKTLFNRIFRVLLWVTLIIIGLSVLLYILFSIPYIQQKATEFAVGELKKTLNTEISIDQLRFSPFNRVLLKGIYIEDQAKDTMLYAEHLDVGLNLWKFIKSGKLTITSVDLDTFLVNVNRKDRSSDFNFQFIIDAFSSDDTIKSNRTKSSLVVVIEDINLRNGQFNYNVLSDTLTPKLFNTSHISLYNLAANIDLSSIDPDKLDIELNSLSTKEKSGIEIKGIKGHLYSEKSQLWVDGLSLFLPESFLIMSKARYNLSTNKLELTTTDTEISPGDLTSFLPNLKFLTNKISLNINIRGVLPTINIDSLSISYGEDSYLRGRGSLTNYEKYESSGISLFIDSFKVSPSAITSFARLGDSTFVLPSILQNLENIYLKGQVTGQLGKFLLETEIWNRQGAINLLATGKIDTTFRNFNVTGQLWTQNLNLANLFGSNSGLGRLTAQLDLRIMKNEVESLNARVKGNIETLVINNETVKNLPFNAYYNAREMGVSAKADWRIGKIYVDASMNHAKVPDIHINLKVDTLHIDHFYKNEAWINPRLSLVLNGKIKGLDIDNMTGFINMDSLCFHDADSNFRIGNFILEAGKKSQNNKFLNLSSSLLTASISGQYSFMSLADELSVFMYSYFPDVFQQTKRIGLKSKKGLNDFTFKVTVNNTQELGKIFAFPLNIIDPATISGHINTINEKINIVGNIPYIRYGSYDIKSLIAGIENSDSALSTVIKSKILMDKGYYRLALDAIGAENSIHALLKLSSNDTDFKMNGQIETLSRFSRDEVNELVSTLKIYPSDITVEKMVLNLFPAEISAVGSRTEIHHFGIGVNKKRYFGAEGVISESASDSLKAYFDHAQIGDLLEAFDIKNIRGCVHGNIILTDLLNQPKLYTRGFEIADIVIFSDTLGTLNLESRWSEDFGGARLNATMGRLEQTYAEINGTIYTNPDSLDLQIRLDEMPLDWTEPFLTEIFNKVAGTVSTNLMLEGSMRTPKLRGIIGFNNTRLGIGYTNVIYTISDTVRVSPDRIGFDMLKIKDPQGNLGTVTASLTHNNFKDMKYILNMQMNKLMVLNTEHRIDSIFYGKVFASGTTDITGDDNGINMKMQIRNNGNSRLNILLPQHAEASDYKSVVYINVPPEKLKKTFENTEEPFTDKLQPIDMKVALNVTPDIVLGVVINPSTGDEMQVKGNGIVNFNYNTQTKNISIYGDYTLTEGVVRLNLQNIRRLQFAIENGSKLYFLGDPSKTRFDITAFRRVRTELKTLNASFASDNYPSKVDVDCILHIKGTIDKIDVTYDIRLPGSSDDLQARVNSYINTDEQKILQFASLVATGSFYSNVGNNTNFGSTLWTNLASSALSKGLTSLVNSMLGDKWQIGTDISSTDAAFSDMNMSVNVSRKFLNDKLRVKANVGYRNNRRTVSNNNFTGDFYIEYQLNSMWTLRVYSLTNDRFYQQAPTTQGIGIMYY